MARAKLTKGRIDLFSCPPGKAQAFLWDSVATGLAVRATPRSAKKVFVFQGARADGSKVRVKIGAVGAWHIETGDPAHPGAREEARRLKLLLAQGKEPRADKAERAKAAQAARIEAVRREAPFSEAWAAYIAARKEAKRTTGKALWSPRHLRDHENLARLGGRRWQRGERTTNPGPLAPLMARPLRELDAERLKGWLRDETAKRSTQARLAFGALRAFVGWCDDSPVYRGLVDPAIFDNGEVRKLLPRKGAKRDVLEKAQLATWFDAVRRLDNPTAAAYLQILLLTGARREELAALEWANVDFKWRKLTIRDKVEGERTIPLTPFVAELLRDLKARDVRPLRLKPGEEWAPSPWVFVSKAAESGRIADPRLPHSRALAAAGLEGLTLHGLRRSFGTLSEWVECPAGIAAQIMGHKPSATAEKHYRARPLDLLRLWHTRIEAWILAEAGLKQPRDETEQRPGLEAVPAAAA